MEKKIVNFRLTEKEKAKLERRAREAGMSMTAYVRLLLSLNLMDKLSDNKNKG